MLTLAHRGDWSAGTENSIRALLAACSLPGVDGVEFDVRASADGVPVLVHDRNLGRIAGTDRPVRSLPVAELAPLGIATLADVLAALPPSAFLDVELKEDVVAAVAPLLLGARGMSPRTAVVASFDPRVLEGARDAMPGWRRWLNVYAIDSRAVARAIGLGCEALACEYRGVDRRTLAMATEAGLRVVAWPVSRRSSLERLRRLGVFAVCLEGAALRG